jgi:hypothetical protein
MMATEKLHPAAAPQPVQQQPHRGVPISAAANTAASPPSKRELASWWKKFRKTTEKNEENGEQFSTSSSLHWLLQSSDVPHISGPLLLINHVFCLTSSSTSRAWDIWGAISRKHQIRQRCDIFDKRTRRELHLWLCSYCGCQMWRLSERERWVLKWHASTTAAE